MNHTMTDIVKHSLLGMADLLLDYASEEGDVDSQQENIAIFLIDCENLMSDEPEFTLLQGKFEEEFENHRFYSELDLTEAFDCIGNAAEKLVQHRIVPQVIRLALMGAYKR